MFNKLNKFKGFVCCWESIIRNWKCSSALSVNSFGVGMPRKLSFWIGVVWSYISRDSSTWTSYRTSLLISGQCCAYRLTRVPSIFVQKQYLNVYLRNHCFWSLSFSTIGNRTWQIFWDDRHSSCIALSFQMFT